MAFDSRPSMAAVSLGTGPNPFPTDLWQRRFWEHAIRDEGDYARHVNYVHFNPAKHGYVSVVAQWPLSTFHRWGKASTYPRDSCGEGALDVAAGERSR